MKHPIGQSLLPVVVLTMLVGGCAGPWAARDEEGTITFSRKHAVTSPQEEVAEADKSLALAKEAELAQESPPLSSETALASVLDELQEIGAIDPNAQQQLMDDLKQTKPEHYGLVVDQFRAALAYRQQMAARDQANAALAQSAAERPEQTAASQTQANARQRVAANSNSATRPAPGAPTSHAPQREAAVVVSDTAGAPTATANPHHFAASRPLPPPPEASAVKQDNQMRPVSYEADQADSVAAANWSDNLAEAIDQLKQEVAPNPHTVEEVHLHMRLRALELLDGREEEALRPIPGATPAQQDYWAKQLYALSTFLDEQTYVDSKTRAAAALVHLDAARSQLAEQATLQVRNLAFVDSADGFGEYKTAEKTKFQPGAQATLYTEVENYRSESTKRGYRTLLTTSYQILDKAGQRVDGGQFPDVEDYCQNRRRDFHMQYTIPLPTRIYAGQYEMQLIITDGLSNKIGQASVPFEIIE